MVNSTSNALGVINQHKANEMAARIIADFGLPIRPTDKVKDLSVAYQQMVEIMKAYSRENLRILHPLPRVNEIAYDVDDNPKAYYIQQARNGLFARQAIICDVLGISIND